MNKIVNSLGNKLVMHKMLYYILNLTWGILATLIGYIMLLFLLLSRTGKVEKIDHVLAYRLNRNTSWGYSIGMVIIIGKNASTYLTYHELGHSVQNALFGPFTFLLVYIPSVIRFWIRSIMLEKGKAYTSKYDDIWFEGTATSIGSYYVVHKYGR